MGNNKNKVNIEGVLYEQNEVKQPDSGRLFRSAWIAPDDSLAEKVIRLDLNSVGEICHTKRRAWRNWAENQPFSYDGDTFDSDEKSLTRIERLNNMIANPAIKPPKTFTSHTGKEHKVTSGWLNGLYAASVQHVIDVHEENKKHKAMIKKHVKAKMEDQLQKMYEKFEIDIGTE